MSVALKSSQALSELVLHHEAQLRKLSERLSAIKSDLATDFARSLADITASERNQNITDISTRISAVRTEYFKNAEARIIAAEQQLRSALTERAIRYEGRFAELENDISEKTKKKISDLSETEFKLSAKIEKILDDSRKTYAREFEKKAERMHKEFSERAPTMIDAFKGNWSSDLLLKRGDLFGFRGSTYLALKDTRGITPTRQTQTGKDAIYQLVAAAGAPGPQSNGSGGVGWSPVPASASSPGVAGSLAYDGSYLYVCVAAATWVRAPISSWS